MANSRTSRRSHNTAAYDKGTTVYEKAAVWLIAAMPMIATVGYGSADVWALIPLSLLTLLLCLLWAADAAKRGRFTVEVSPLQVPVLFLILLGLVQMLPLGAPAAELPGGGSLPLTLDPFATSYFVIRLILLLVYFTAVLTFISGRRRVRSLAFAVVVFGALIAFVGILQRLASPDAIYGMRPTPQAIPFGPFVNQHHFAAFIEMTFGLTLAALAGGAVKRDRRALLVIAGLLMLVAVVLTGSRGGMIAMFCVTAFVLAATFAGSGRGFAGLGKKHILAGGAVIAIVIMLVLFLAGADPIIRGIGMQSQQPDVTSGRMHFWSVAWSIFTENPLIGAGLDAFGVAFTRHDTWGGLFRVEQAHNDYLQMLADGGVLAFAAVAGFIFLLYRKGLNAIGGSTSAEWRAVAVGALAGCSGIIVHSLFDFPLRTPSNAYFFLLLAALATAAQNSDREVT
jgi:O-antigen ligase